MPPLDHSILDTVSHNILCHYSDTMNTIDWAVKAHDQLTDAYPQRQAPNLNKVAFYGVRFFAKDLLPKAY